MKALPLLLLPLALLCLTACGDEEATGPMIAAPQITCGPWLGEERIDYDGDVLQKLAVGVSGDQAIVSVTATWNGAILDLDLGESGLYEIDTADMQGAVLRCDSAVDVLIRAEDAQGVIGERLAKSTDS